MSVLIRKAIRLALIATALLAASASAAAFSSESPQTAQVASQTVAIFADRAIPDDQWQALVAALDREFAVPSSETSALSAQNIQILRGDHIAPGTQVQSAISIYLHGNCDLPARAYTNQPHLIRGSLGWVKLRNGQIEPFANVDCTLLGQLLVRRTAFLKQDQQKYAMPTAIARVIVHEWVHIASQSASHSKHGVTKAEFTADDLLSPIPVTVARLAITRQVER